MLGAAIWRASSGGCFAAWSRGATLAAALAVSTLVAEAADPSTARRGSRSIGIDTRFGDLVQEGTKQHLAKNYARAISLYTEALQMRPDPTNAAILYMQRGAANMYAGHHAAALADYDKARQLRPSEPLSHNDAAWLRAASPHAELRNGKLAVQQATRACELTGWKNSDLLDTLAAAHAEAGDFERAIQYQRQAIGRAPLSDRLNMHKRLGLFERRIPYRLKSTHR